MSVGILIVARVLLGTSLIYAATFGGSRLALFVALLLMMLACEGLAFGLWLLGRRR